MALRTLFAKGRRNALKILTLALGLAAGLVLAAKVCFEQTFDSFHSDADRIFILSEAAIQNGNLDIYQQTSGGTAPAMKEHYPEVEESTRMTFFESGASLIDANTKARYSAPSVQMADSCFFKIFDRDCLAGNITTALGVPENAVISSRMALTMASDRNRYAAAREVIGRQFTIGSRGNDIVLTVAGVYYEFPANSTFRPDVILALPGIGQFMYDGTQDYVGNDRYKSFVKLKKGISAADFNGKMDSYVERYLPVEEMKAANVSLSYRATHITDMHTGSDDVRNTILVLGIVAFALLLVSILNYMLIVISTSVTRSREMALRKCLGSETLQTAMMMFSESIVHTLLAGLIAAALLLACRGFVENFLGIGLSDLFTGKPLLLAVGIILVIIMLNGLAPTIIFDRIPVATAFRSYSSNRRTWKMWLLIVEFTLVAFLCVLISTITLQYRRMNNADLGFSVDSSIELASPESNAAQHSILMDKLRAMPQVADAAFAFQSLFGGFSGNNVRLPGHDEDLFNVHDRYYVDDHYFNAMGIEIIEGRNFNPDLASDREMIVDTRFVEELKSMTGWNDVLGRQVGVSEHGDDITIVGVINPISLGSFSKQADEYFSRPMAFFYCNPDEPMGRYHYPYQIVRYHKMSQDILAETRDVIAGAIPGQETYMSTFQENIIHQLSDTLKTRNSILAGGIITLLIAVLGLIGYTVDEIRRRSKEIAVRRVNGAQFSQIRNLFQLDTMRIAVPSAIAGCIAGVLVALRWEQNFTMQVGMPWWIVLGAAVFTIGSVSVVTDLFVSRTANTNPAESIKTE